MRRGGENLGFPADGGGAPSLREVLHAPPSARDDSVVSSGHLHVGSRRGGSNEAARSGFIGWQSIGSQKVLHGDAPDEFHNLRTWYCRHAARRRRGAADRKGVADRLLGFRRSPAHPFFNAFVERLRELGYPEGRNLFIEWRSAEGRAERLPDLATELVASNVDLIVSINTQTTLAIKQATKTIPIVAVAPVDPVEIGPTKRLARPDGNITGLWIGQLGGKRLELLKEMLPTTSRVAMLLDPTNASHPVLWRETEMAAQILGVRLYRVEVRVPEEIAAAFAQISKVQAEALVLFAGPMIFNERRRIAELAAVIRLHVLGHEAVESGDGLRDVLVVGADH